MQPVGQRSRRGWRPGAAGVLLWFTASQARSARESLQLTRVANEAALDQAHSARESAKAASLSAHAVVDQAKSERDALKVAQQERDRAERPEFTITATGLHEGRCLVQARMQAGPPRIRVTVDWWESKASWPTSPTSRQTQMTVGSEPDEHEVVKNHTFGFSVPMPPQADQVRIKVDLRCVDTADESRTWDCPEVVEWAKPRAPHVW